MLKIVNIFLNYTALLTAVFRCLAERNFMMTLEGGCSVPLGVSSALSESRILSLKGGVFAFAGEESIVEESKVTLTICSQM